MPSKTDYVSASIIEDSDNDNNDIDSEEVVKKLKKQDKFRNRCKNF